MSEDPEDNAKRPLLQEVKAIWTCRPGENIASAQGCYLQTYYGAGHVTSKCSCSCHLPFEVTPVSPHFKLLHELAAQGRIDPAQAMAMLEIPPVSHFPEAAEKTHGKPPRLLIEQQAEVYRRKLALKPWEQYRQEALSDLDRMTAIPASRRALYKAEERRTGRSTKGLLHAIAEVHLLNAEGSPGTTLVVVGMGGNGGRALKSYAETLVRQLGLKIDVARKAWGPSIVYVDHLVGWPSHSPG